MKTMNFLWYRCHFCPPNLFDIFSNRSEFLWYSPDIMPTLVEIAQTKLPGKIGGISIVPALLNVKHDGSKQKIHEYLYWEFNLKEQ